MAKIHICLDSNRSISSELLDQFYGRPTCLPEERFASLALNRTSDLSPYHPIFSRIQQSSTTEEADELSEKAADVCEKIRAIQAVYNSLPEEEQFFNS